MTSTAPAKSSTDGYLPALDGLRAVSILLVLANHTANQFANPLLNKLFDKISFHGNIGVSIFFAISGILITGRLLDEERVAGAISLKKFYIRRAFRILPPALFYLAMVGVLAWGLALRVTGFEIASAALFFRNYVLDGLWLEHWFTTHFWSLSVEEHFYLFVPALVLVVVQMRRRIWVLGGLTAAVWAWRWWQRAHGIGDGKMWPHSDSEMDALLFAATLACLVRDETAGVWLRRLLTFPVTLGIGLATAWVRLRSPLLVHEALTVGLGLFVLGMTLNGGSWLGRALEWGPVRWLGRLSYSLYLWQQLWFGDRFLGADPPLGRFGHWPLNFACALACACVSYYLLERPSIKMGHRLAGAPLRGRREESSEVRDGCGEPVSVG